MCCVGARRRSAAHAHYPAISSRSTRLCVDRSPISEPDWPSGKTAADSGLEYFCDCGQWTPAQPDGMGFAGDDLDSLAWRDHDSGLYACAGTPSKVSHAKFSGKSRSFCGVATQCRNHTHCIGYLPPPTFVITTPCSTTINP